MSAPIFHVAVDPGAGGGIAWFETGKGVQAVKMPGTDAELVALARRLSAEALTAGETLGVWIELVGGYVKPARLKQTRGENGQLESVEIEGGQPGSAMFSFGENYGLVRGVFLALGAEVQLVRPQQWMAPFFLKKRGRTKTEWKNVLKSTAQRRFPGLKVTLATADALLILAYSALRNPPRGMETPEKAQRGQIEAPESGAGVCFKPPAGFEREWARVDAVDEIVNEIAVARKSPGSGTENAMGGLYVADWKGQPWVIRGATKPGGQEFVVRRATPRDLETLPKKS